MLSRRLQQLEEKDSLSEKDVLSILEKHLEAQHEKQTSSSDILEQIRTQQQMKKFIQKILSWMKSSSGVISDKFSYLS